MKNELKNLEDSIKNYNAALKELTDAIVRMTMNQAQALVPLKEKMDKLCIANSICPVCVQYRNDFELSLTGVCRNCGIREQKERQANVSPEGSV